MSGQFEIQLADWLHEHLTNDPPQGGQKLLAEFHDATTADKFAESLVALADATAHPIPGSDDTLPAITATDGVPLYVARVKPDVDDDSEAHVITQGFATRMRNLVSDSVHEDTPFAMLMVLESDATLDTLEASENLFGEDGSLNLSAFRQDVLAPDSCESKQGRALLTSLNDILEGDSLYAEDVEVLDTLCEIRHAIDEQNADPLPDLIAELPQFIREDYITPDWFAKDASEADLELSTKEFLEGNQDHAKTLRRAHRTGTDTESKLSSTYEETFVNNVKDTASWKQTSHTAAEKHEIERTSRQFRDLEVTAGSHRIYSPMNEDATRRGVIATPDAGELRLSAVFSADLDDVPYEYVDSDGNTPSGARVSKRENRLTATLEGLPHDEPSYGRLLMYVGKKTTQGMPTHEFDLAVVPQWFYDATADVSLDVSVEDEALVSHGDEEITLTPPARIDFDFSTDQTVVEITDETEQSVPFDSYLVLNPAAPDTVETVGCLVAPPDEIPIRIMFRTEVTTVETEEVVFPLMLAAIEDPTRWGAEDLQLPSECSIDTSRGQIHSGAIDGVRFEESMLELIQTEEDIIRDGSPQRRVVDSEDLQAGKLQQAASLDAYPDLQAAYEALFKHFEDRSRTPSTDSWDHATQARVADVLEAYQTAVASVGEQPDFSEHEPLRGIGVLDSGKSEKTWLTPFHPVMLAYGYRIATWRDEDLVPNGATAGFRTDRFLDRFNPSGLLPYIVSKDTDSELLRGLLYEDNPLWGVYSPIESPGSVTPRYMERVIRDKLDTFMHSFPLLFELHEGRNFVINLVNMGDLRPVIKGLYEFFKRVESSRFTPPQILLRIYGGPAEGESLDRFFGDNSKSRLRTQLEQKNDEIVDLLRSNLMYVRCGEYTESTHEDAHMTFFRGLLQEESGITELGDLPSGMLLDGLLARESIDVQSSSSGTVYSVGFGHDADGHETIVEGVARIANTLEAGRSNNKYLTDHTLKKTVKSSHKTDLQKLWDDSLWVVHVQPNVGLEFYIESENEIGSDDGMVMIHYNDQYDSSSPNYDVITSTTKRSPYLTALERALEEGNLGEYLDPAHILSTLLAIDGELALELQNSSDKSVVEKAGFIGGLALSRALLNANSTEYTWVPLSLNELSRHDRATRGGTAGLLQYTDGGAASDDICMVGVPDDVTQAPIKLWIVETKGGTSQLKKGREQVAGAVENLEDIFHPDVGYSDAQLLYSEFGKTIIDVAKRMAGYNVISDAEIDVISENAVALNEGAFDIEFLTDANGHIGEVIRVRSDTLKTDVDLSHEVRTIDTSLETLKLLDEPAINTVLSDLNPDQLAFDITPPSERTAPVPGATTAEATPDTPFADSEGPNSDDSGSESAASGGDVNDTSSSPGEERVPAEPTVGDAADSDTSDTAPQTTANQDDAPDSKEPAPNTDAERTEPDTEPQTEHASQHQPPEQDGTQSGTPTESTDTATAIGDLDSDPPPADPESEVTEQDVGAGGESGFETAAGSDSTPTNTEEPSQTGESSGAEDTEFDFGAAPESSTPDPSNSRADQKPASEPAGSDSNQPADAADGTQPSPTPSERAGRAAAILESMEQSEQTSADIDRSKLVNDLKREFESLGVQIHPPNPAGISVGPRKIGVNVHPKEGQTVEGILQKLDSLSVHIQAEGDIVGTLNPSKGAVRLEIPHGEPVTVYLRDGIEALQEELQHPVTIPLGVDVDNEHHALSMLDEKHALIGGATGSGKSNFLSSLVASFAITTSPDTLKMSILDPKGVDFGRFADLPHVQEGTYLDTPDACTEYLMELLETELQDRKQRLQETGFPSVNELNEYADEMGHDPMPYHVIIIDEYADLIMSLADNKDEFEDAVTRLAQVGRAHGYVIFLATQRPSADIVSGKIKANFPCRISFRLPSNTDSRVILDQPGAEDLGGAGDMIAVTQDGDLRLQGYRLSPADAIAIRDAYNSTE